MSPHFTKMDVDPQHPDPKDIATHWTSSPLCCRTQGLGRVMTTGPQRCGPPWSKGGGEDGLCGPEEDVLRPATTSTPESELLEALRLTVEADKCQMVAQQLSSVKGTR